MVVAAVVIVVADARVSTTLLGVAWLMMLFVGCGGPSATTVEARRGLVRVEVARLELPPPTTAQAGETTSMQRRQHYRTVIAEAAALREYGLAAEAATYWGEWELAGERLPQAEAAFREALTYDKLEQQRLRSDSNPRVNSAQIAISLANVSLVLEQQDRLEEAVFYADRAFRINRALNLPRRIRHDTDRLAELYERLGNQQRAEEVRTFARELLDAEETVEEAD